MLRDIKKIILLTLTLTHPVKLTFPAEGINRINKLLPRAIRFKPVLTSVVELTSLDQMTEHILFPKVRV